jgi:hypothetical protein
MHVSEDSMWREILKSFWILCGSKQGPAKQGLKFPRPHCTRSALAPTVPVYRCLKSRQNVRLNSPPHTHTHTKSGHLHPHTWHVCIRRTSIVHAYSTDDPAGPVALRTCLWERRSLAPHAVAPTGTRARTRASVRWHKNPPLRARF